jgi:hypothetical protein
MFSEFTVMVFLREVLHQGFLSLPLWISKWLWEKFGYYFPSQKFKSSQLLLTSMGDWYLGIQKLLILAMIQGKNKILFYFKFTFIYYEHRINIRCIKKDISFNHNRENLIIFLRFFERSNLWGLLLDTRNNDIQWKASSSII